MGKRLAWLVASSLSIGCGAPTPPRLDNAPAPPTATVAAPIQTAVPIATAAPSASAAPAPVETTPAPDPSLSGPPFPPPSFTPPHARSAKPQDGVFSLVEEGAAAGTSALAKTTVHPNPYKKDPVVVVLAIDLRRVDLVLVAGTQEPESKTVPVERRPGLVAAADLPSLIAAFNGGFQTKHGQFGMKVNGEEFLAPRQDACTVGLLEDGSIRIGTFSALSSIESKLRSYRQTPPCLIEAGQLHPKLPNEDTARLWGAAIGGNREIRRTALGLDQSGRILFFGIGEWIWARDLALAMKAAGAVDAAELDINWSYTRFLLYDRASPPSVVSTLIEKVQYTKDGYISKPAPRDFFYLRRKAHP